MIANTFLGDKLICAATDQLICSYEAPSEGRCHSSKKSLFTRTMPYSVNMASDCVFFLLSLYYTAKEQLVTWAETKVNEKGHNDGIRLVLKHKKV